MGATPPLFISLTTRIALAIYAAFVISPYAAAAPPLTQAADLGAERSQVGPEDYTFSYWLNGRRGDRTPKSHDILVFESGRYALMLDMARLDRPRFGRLHDGAGYIETLTTGADRLKTIGDATLNLDVELQGRRYHATRLVEPNTKHKTRSNPNRLKNAWLWESGRIAQHLELRELVLESDDGHTLPATVRLGITALPSSITLAAHVKPGVAYHDGAVAGVTGGGLAVITKPVDIPHSDRMDPARLTVESWIRIPTPFANQNTQAWLLCKNRNEWVESNYGFGYINGTLSARMNIGGGKENAHQIKANPKSFKTDAWNHLALTYDGKTMRFYVNGKQESEKTIGRERRPGKHPLRLGGRGDGHGEPAKVFLDDVRVWGQPLSASTIKKHADTPQRIGSRKGLVYENLFGATAPVTEQADAGWDKATISLSLNAGGHTWEAPTTAAAPWPIGRERDVNLVCDFTDTTPSRSETRVSIAAPKGQKFPTRYDPSRGCYVATVKGLRRGWTAGYTEIRDYDEFTIDITHDGKDPVAVPIMLDFYGPGNVTGMVPILCTLDGSPTGIPVQLSKNWHESDLGAYARPYMLIPSQTGTTQYRLRIAYGFYGDVPSASHAQLSLVGWGGNGRWDQLAIGCWGETFCFDIDQTNVDVAITDVRGLMLRNGLAGKKWTWNDAGWGGDWLKANGPDGKKLLLAEMKTAYLAQGPCLTDVRHQGYFGRDRQVKLDAKIQTLRTDDYARTFQTLNYAFKASAVEANGWLFKMGGRAGSWSTPRVAYGNADGLLGEVVFDGSHNVGDLVLDRVPLTGKGPWWIAFPGSTSKDDRDWGKASRALIIRGYDARFAGRTYTAPSITLPVVALQDNNALDVDLWLSAPASVSRYQAGDRVHMDTEWITLPRHVDDYYGPNAAFRKHLKEHPASWKTVYREASGNNLQVKAVGGVVTGSYPIQIQVTSPRPRVTIAGGIGHVPIRFAGLASAHGHTLHRMVNGQATPFTPADHSNDFWQTDFDPVTNTYGLTFNLPLDGVKQSSWVLHTGD